MIEEVKSSFRNMHSVCPKSHAWGQNLHDLITFYRPPSFNTTITLLIKFQYMNFHTIAESKEPAIKKGKNKRNQNQAPKIPGLLPFLKSNFFPHFFPVFHAYLSLFLRQHSLSSSILYYQMYRSQNIYLLEKEKKNFAT